MAISAIFYGTYLSASMQHFCAVFIYLQSFLNWYMCSLFKHTIFIAWFSLLFLLDSGTYMGFRYWQVKIDTFRASAVLEYHLLPTKTMGFMGNDAWQMSVRLGGGRETSGFALSIFFFLPSNENFQRSVILYIWQKLETLASRCTKEQQTTSWVLLYMLH